MYCLKGRVHRCASFKNQEVKLYKNHATAINVRRNCCQQYPEVLRIKQL